ncbi:MAG: DUF2490 domain-containing protein [Candidatus Riflebacteria bacterium]|nr:DUF2490 domain-containing protein [Candidatus Riflebacteria bacterium]
MKTKITFLICMLVIINCNLFGASDDKLQLTEKFSYKINNTMSFKMELAGKSDESFADQDQYSVDVGISKKIGKRWVLTPRYRHIQLGSTNTGAPSEHRYHMNLEYFNKIGKANYEIRHRYEYRQFENRYLKHRYANRVRIYIPTKKNKISVMLLNKLYYDIDKFMFNATLPGIGLKFKTKKNESLEIYFAREYKKAGDKWDIKNHLLAIDHSVSF